jgi:DNA-binding NarL/FixJ family response regulator
MYRILFVDDEPGVLTGLRRMLRARREGWDMRFVDSPVAALDLMDRERIDVIVSDFRMPGLDGGQLLAEVRRRHPDTARLILSGQTAEKDMLRVVSIAHQFLSKPCGPDQLTAAIDRALCLRRELGGERVRAEMTGIDALPGLPSTLHSLLEELERPESDVCGVAQILQRDAALASRVLEQVNRLFFAGRSQVASLEVALARVGIQAIRSLALMEEIVRAFPAPDRLSRGWLARFEAHALR